VKLDIRKGNAGEYIRNGGDSMGDLISRKALMRKLFFTEDGRKYPTRDIDNFPVTVSLENLRKIIRNVPTAYDVDKVVEQLKECERYIYDAVSDEDNYVIDTEKAIEIVKGAVKDE